MKYRIDHHVVALEWTGRVGKERPFRDGGCVCVCGGGGSVFFFVPPKSVVYKIRVSWYFKPSQPQGIISGPRETSIKRLYSWNDQ